MNKLDLTREGLVGVQVEFDIQELIAIKDKWSMVVAKLAEAQELKHNRVRCQIQDLEDMNVLMLKIVDGITSTNEVHQRLFAQPEEDVQQTHY